MARAVTDPPSSGRVALVTGAGRDREIGTAVCRALAAAGDRVAFTVQPGGPSDGAALAAELSAVAIPADLAEADAASALLDAVEERLGAAPAVLVNNAAYETRAGFAELDAAALDAHYAVNVRAMALLSVEFARRYPGGAGGRIVNFSSGQSLGPMPEELAYAATKGAVLSLTRVMALDQSADHRDLAECALEQMGILDPFDELALEDVG